MKLAPSEKKSFSLRTEQRDYSSLKLRDLNQRDTSNSATHDK